MERAKVLILQENIPSYRVPIYNKLAEKYDVTVSYSDKSAAKSTDLFKTHYLKRTFIGPFEFHRGSLRLSKYFDVVIFDPNLHFLDFCLLPFCIRKFKTITHSIGFRCSYTRKYDLNRKKTFSDNLMKLVLLKSDANIFYMKENMAFWDFDEVFKTCCFEARNTVAVKDTEINEKKEIFLFIGSLYKEKGLEELIYSYKEALDENLASFFPKLVIIGDGPMMSIVKEIVEKQQLSSNVDILGAVYDEEIIASYFNKAIACISPSQAGLSVPRSMGYGVPFVTQKDAITGGEINHIEDGKTGLLMNDLSELKEVMLDISNNPAKYLEMGKRAKQYYLNNANVDIMTNGFIKAIEYTLSFK